MVLEAQNRLGFLIYLGLYENILPFLFLYQDFSTVKVLLQQAAACLHWTLYIHPSKPFLKHQK